MSLVLHLGDSEFEQEVLKSDVPVLVDFWAPWCGPCVGIGPVIEQLADEYKGKLKVVKVNVDEHRQMAARYNVRGIPNLLFFKSGEVQEQIVGAVAKQELTTAIDKIVV